MQDRQLDEAKQHLNSITAPGIEANPGSDDAGTHDLLATQDVRGA
jgi:hypothetical protein